MMRHIFILIFISGAFGLNAQPSLEKKLNLQLQQYEVQIENLMISRALPYYGGKVDAQKLLSGVEEYREGGFGELLPVSFIFYHFQNDTLHNWLIKGGKIFHHASLMTADSLNTLNNTLKFALTIDSRLGLTSRSQEGASRNLKKYRLRTPECLDILGQVLFPPNILSELQGTRFLLIIPAINISTIPLSLLTPWGSEGGHLIDSLSYSFVGNFTQFFQEVDGRNYYRRRMSESGRIVNPLFVGNPAFEDPCTLGLATLKGAEAEVNALASRFEAGALVGYYATKALVMDRLPSSDLVYFATHGWSDVENPLEGSFLALYDSGGCGYLTPLEIQEMKLPMAPLVILSACQTGLGKVHEAGIIGLARAFLHAGARCVTMSLWDVNDAETSLLMGLFLEELMKPHLFSPAEPWRQAVVKYRAIYSDDPLNWASFQTFGVPYRPIFEVALKKGN